MPCLLAAFTYAGTTSSYAADGTILRTITAQNYSCSVGTGIAFDGSNLLLSCNYNNIITAVSPVTGEFAHSYSIDGISAIGALAWDRGRNTLWACGGFGGDDTVVHKINLDTHSATEAFRGTDGCPDGLAFDGTDDTLYLSADVANHVQHYKADGTLIGTIDVTGKLGGCGNSGIAVGGPYIFLANNGCSQIYRAAKDNVSSPVLFGEYPARIEDMECDDLTFRASSKAAIWTKDAYDGVLNAFELNSGDCGFGGQPPASPDSDTDGDGLPDSWETQGVDVDHDGTPDLDLRSMGADPQHKDLFIEVDWMRKPDTCIWFYCWGGQNFAPNSQALADVRTRFASAPVGNPDGTPGVRLHIDSGPGSVMNPVTGATWGNRSKANEVQFKEVLGFSEGQFYNWSEFDSIKGPNFGRERRNAFHYTLYADIYQGTPSDDCLSGRCSSGISRGIPASDWIITDGPSGAAGFSKIQERGTFMHELGHNLNLHHGGDSEANNWNPNYLSIMNYSYQLFGLPPDDRIDYSRGAPYADWAHLVFTGGSVGAFGDVVLPATSAADELTAAAAKSAGVFAANGDGTVRFVSPTVMLPQTGTQHLAVDVTNIGQVAAGYSIGITAPGLAVSIPSATVNLAAGAVQRVNLPVDTSQLRPGTSPLTVNLAGSTSGADLSTDTATLVVPDLLDQNQLRQARDALSRLRSLPSDSGLDPAVRAALISALSAGLPWTARVALTGSPSSKFTADYVMRAPEFKPSAANPQSIKVNSWPNNPVMTLSVDRVQPASAAYKGTLRLQRPDGRVVNATVSLVWDPNARTFTGSWKEKDGGELKVTLTEP